MHQLPDEGPSPASTRDSTGQRPSELTLRAIVLGVVLSAILAGANAYLGLFAGMTVSASIPAAVVSMGLLRAVGGSLLENNLVQTAASAGESAAAGAIFTLPALILLGAWSQFDLLICALLIGMGGIVGVLFTTLLRRALIVEAALQFPEGVATAEVLLVGHGRQQSALAAGHSPAMDRAVNKTGLSLLLTGALFGAVSKFFESGLSWSRSVVEGAATTTSGTFYFGMGISPALAAVGSIVGFEIAFVIFLGGVLNWVCILPFVVEPAEGKNALELAWQTWSDKTRYVGVGAMTLGGLAALVEVRHSILHAVRAGLSAFSASNDLQKKVVLPLSEQELPARGVLVAIALFIVPLFFLFLHLLGQIGISLLLAVLVIVVGFLFSAVAAYMAGLVGSSNNPVSGVTIATILFTSLLLSFLGVAAVAPGLLRSAGPAAAILVGSVVCTAAAIGGDNMQDLKAGQLVGATPYRQQIMQLVGVVTAALVLGPVLQLLLDAYGFGPSTVQNPDSLRAPQATLMASVADGVFGGDLPWDFFSLGLAIGVLVIALDLFLIRRKVGFRTPVLAVALGLYLPWEISVPVLLGGLVAKVSGPSPLRLLMGAGLITGEALMGIFLAGLFAATGGLQWLRPEGKLESQLLSVVILGAALVLLYRKRETVRV